jgi:DNA-directed RNA polymerase beta subunit
VYPEETPVPIDNISTADMITLIFAEITRKGIAGHHINSMNSFYDEGIRQIATKVFAVEGRLRNERDDKDPADRDIAEISYKVEFTNTRLTRPSTTKYPSGKPELLTPNMARVKGQTYAIQMYIDANITATAHYKNGGSKSITDEIRDHRIAAIPCLVGSSMCNTYMTSREVRKQWQEDPNDPGGYYIIKGGEWVPDNQENLTHNIFHCYLQKYENEVVRGTFISKSGDAFENSYQTLVRYLNTGAIIVDFTITKKLVLQMPFYIIFRALGMTSDRDITSHIVYDVEGRDQMTVTMLAILERAFDCEDAKFNPIRKTTHPPDVIEFLAAKLTEVAVASAKRDDNVVKYQNNTVLNMFDRYFLPHVGIEPEHRIRKLKFLGHLINKLILVHMGIVEQTDRDSYKNKRVHSAGTSMAKTFKTHYNIAFVQQIKKSIVQALKTTPFSQVQLAKAIKQVTRSEALEKPLTQSITAGTGKMITHRTVVVKNRVSAQTLYHKNDLNVKSTLNTINTPDGNMGSKNTERADVMRRVHPTYLGFIDVTQSADTGEKVGMTKQLASTASVCGSSSSYNLKKILLRDPAIIPIDDVLMEDIARRKLSKVFVGGDWIGCCEKSHELTYRYRQARRHGDINPYVTIVWEPLVREVYFWTDVGRLLRPLVIVYNNIAEYNAKVRAGVKVEFKQWIRLTSEQLRKLQRREITMETLRQERVIEYISPEEQESAFIALNIDLLRSRAGDVRYRYTHCNVDQSIFGVVTLAAPTANHSNTVRNTYYTNHRKQSTGWFTLNYPYRIDKNVTLQHYCERPMVSAFSDAITCPNGQNTIVALMLHGGKICLSIGKTLC